jgi:hypothetical protein
MPQTMHPQPGYYVAFWNMGLGKWKCGKCGRGTAVHCRSCRCCGHVAWIDEAYKGHKGRAGTRITPSNTEAAK